MTCELFPGAYERTLSGFDVWKACQCKSCILDWPCPMGVGLGDEIEIVGMQGTYRARVREITPGWIIRVFNGSRMKEGQYHELSPGSELWRRVPPPPSRYDREEVL